MEYHNEADNVLARILRREMPSRVLAEIDPTLVIADIRPQALDHYLALTKEAYVYFDRFIEAAFEAAQLDFFGAVHAAVERLAVTLIVDGGGYRLIANTGEEGFQEVGYFHMHIIAGAWLDPSLPSTSDRDSTEQKFGTRVSNQDLLEQA